MRKSDKLKNIQKANILAEQRFIENNDLTERLAQPNRLNDIIAQNPFIKSYINEILKTLEDNNIHKSNAKNILIYLIDKVL
jgi:hypothetical protein